MTACAEISRPTPGSALSRPFGLALLSLLFVVVCWPAPAGAEQPDSISQLSELRWAHRVVLVLASPDPDADIATLREHARDFDERDTLWFVVRGASVSSNFRGTLDPGFATYLRDTYESGQPVLLIGKDGGVKMRAERLDPDAVFSRIDAMPMRQREMRQSAEGTSKR